LLSSNPGAVVLLAVFAVGAIFFATGTLLVRRTRTAESASALVTQTPPANIWAQTLAGVDEPVDAPIRIDMIERLALLGEPWCAQILERAREQDTDPHVREAADAALLIIGARYGA
jgi:hypothetical protein